MNSFTGLASEGIINVIECIAGTILGGGYSLRPHVSCAGFFTLLIGLMAFAGNLTEMALIFWGYITIYI